MFEILREIVDRVKLTFWNPDTSQPYPEVIELRFPHANQVTPTPKAAKVVNMAEFCGVSDEPDLSASVSEVSLRRVLSDFSRGA